MKHKVPCGLGDFLRVELCYNEGVTDGGRWYFGNLVPWQFGMKYKGGIYMAKGKKHRTVNPELEAEIAEWKDYLMKDLQERVEKNGYKPLSARQMKKTTNGDATYERMLRVIGRGDPTRLERVMLEMVKAGASEQTESFEEAKPFEEIRHFENPESFEEQQDFENAVRFEEATAGPVEGMPEATVEDEPQASKARKKWERSAMLEFLVEKYRELGRVPKQKEIVEWSKAGLCPSYQTCMKLLGVSSKAQWQDLLER